MEEVTVLIARSQAGDKEARETLIEKNLGLVHHIVKRFLGRGYDAEDLFQIGSIGLMSRSLKENGWKVKQASERISHEEGRDATLQEIAEATGLSREDIVMAMEANVEVESIYKSVYQSDGNEIYLVDRLPEKKDENETLLNHMLLQQLLDGLEEEERNLIMLRYFQNKTQVEVAKKLGVSQVQVSRMEKKILVRMREKL